MEIRISHRTLDLDPVDLGDVIRRMSQTVRQLPVVGQNQETFAVPVESPHGIDAFPHALQELDDGRAPLRIGRRGDDAFRLVQEVIDP